MFSNLLKDLRPLKSINPWIGVILGGVALMLRAILSYNTTFVEMYYSRTVFPLVRSVFDNLITWLPFAFIYLLLALVIILLVSSIRNIWKKQISVLAKFVFLIQYLLSFMGFLLFFFLFLWGYNYIRIPVTTQLALEIPELQPQDIKQELFRLRPLVTASRAALGPADIDSAFGENDLPEDFELLVKQDVIRLFQKLGYPTPGNVKARQLVPKGILLRWSTAGVYIPFTGECHIDAGLHPLQKPFVLAHEYCHGLGITDEGTCNFLAYLACTTSDHKFIQYSAYLAYWRTLAVQFRRDFNEEYTEIRAALPPGMIADMDEIYQYMIRYPDFLPQIRDWLYDHFLKAQGVKEGLASYSRIVQMVIAWERKHENYELEKK